MATFQLSNKNKKNKSEKNIKAIIGWVLLGISTFVFLFSATKLLPFLNYFFLGILGVFVYPVSVLGIIISLALLNNKKYVMPKKYAIFLGLSLFLFLSIIQLIILGPTKDLSYSQFVSLNYTKQITAGGLLIGFISSSLAYLIGLPATYILLSLALVVCIAFFVEAVLSLRKTVKQHEPIKLQIREKEEIKKPFNPREDKEKTAKVFKKEESEINVMLDGNKQEEEKRELTAREKLGLVGGFQQTVQRTSTTTTTSRREMLFPQEKTVEKEKVPNGMSMREYLLSPPTVDLEKFRERSEKVKSNNYAAFNAMKASIASTSTSEINKNINELKQTEEINTTSSEPVHDDGRFLSVGNLNEVNPDEITNEAEDIIRSVVQQERVEREEYIEEIPHEERTFNNIEESKYQNQNYQLDIRETNSENSYSQTSYNSPYDNKNNFESVNEVEDINNFDYRDSYEKTRDIEEIESPSDLKQFIDFGDLDDSNEIEEIKEEIKPSVQSFNRDNGLSRDRDNLVRDRDFPNDRKFGEERKDFLNRDNGLTRDNGLERNKPIDEMQRRKDMVKVEEKKEEKIKPYKYKRPSLDLLTTTSDDLSIFNDEIPMKRVALENALENFGIPAKVQNVVIGPTVTRYEIQMPEGISVKRVLSLDADISYYLSAKGIRIEAPIPGRSVVGIEVPNSKVAKVSIKDVLSSKEFNLSPSPLTFALGKDISNVVKVCNLQKMPHLLVAGTTGSGKSVCLNSIIVSILYKASPDEVKFIMIDPKQVELSMYEGLPHMVIPKVITDATKAVNALQWAVDEMERRFKLLSEEGVRNIDEYNKIDKVLQNRVKKMPFIVIIFDEFADFMLVAKNEIEDKIRRITQKARAAGIHLILATQRPSTDVVTGTIKSNLPARIAFKVASRIDSEVILGATGAEKLLGYGDMLYKPTDTPFRIQGCFIDTPETKDFVNYITANNEEIFDEEAFNAINNPGKGTNGGGGDNNSGVDPLLPQALKICIDNGVASTTMVQRKLSIGYPRAARIVDQMEERGYISSAEGSKQRSVYISIEEFYSIFGDIYD